MLYPEPAMEPCKARVNSLETFGSVDGPGVRFVVFLQGCKMRCKYCHNPETWPLEGGMELSAEQLFEKAYRYRSYWGKDMKRGGVTVSGGEPLLQIEFVTEFFKILKARGVHTAIDTSGQPFTREPDWLSKFDELLKYTDLFILDLKELDCEKHKELTGYGCENIMDMATYLSEKGMPLWVRHVLVPGVTDDEKSLCELSEFVSTLKTVERVEILPYHTLGLVKWEQLGISYPLTGIMPPTQEEINRAKRIFE